MAENSDKPFELVSAKRFKFPSVLMSLCPGCNVSVRKDFKHDHLNYPMVNQPLEIWFDHECGGPEDACEEWSVEVVLKVSLEVCGRIYKTGESEPSSDERLEERNAIINSLKSIKVERDELIKTVKRRDAKIILEAASAELGHVIDLIGKRK